MEVFMQQQRCRRFLLLACIGLATVSVFHVGIVLAQQTPVRTRPRSAPARAAQPSAQNTADPSSPQLKAIFEPVSYPDDLQLLDVFFVNQNIEWALRGNNRL